MFKENVAQVNWDFILKENNPDIAYDELINVLKPIYKASFPFKVVKKNHRTRKPWVTQELLNKIRLKNTLYHKFIKTKDANDLRIFKNIRNHLNKELKKARADYYTNQFASCQGRIDLTWKKLNDVLGKQSCEKELSTLVVNGEAISGQELANEFNRHFVSVFSEAKVFNDLHNITSIEDTLFLSPVDEVEVVDTFNTLNNTTSCDIDGFQVKPMKFIFDIISPYLTHIFNKCISNAVFPRGMQFARVSVIYKKGDKNQFGNYRPISILPIFSKLFEKIIHRRFVNFESKHSLISDSQFGFRKHYSTELALLEQKEHILKEIDRNKIVIGIYVDFTKAFDLINHELLLRKLDRYGFRGHASALVKSYLEFRRQAVVVNGFLSDTRPVQCGVPQGSILGPFLFNIFINDVVRAISFAKIVCYADDTSIFLAGDNIGELTEQANDALDRLDVWTKKNALQINSSKTKVVIFRGKNKKVTLIRDICFQRIPLEIVPSIKTLGVMINQKLSWDDHVTYLATKLSQIIGTVYRKREVIPPNVMILIYQSLFYSRLNYCHLVWGTTTQDNLHKLHVLQKSFLRVIENLPRWHTTTELFAKHKILPVTKLYEYRLCHSFKREIKYSTFLLRKIALLEPRKHTCKTRNADIWDVQTYRTTYGLQTLENKLPRLLNSFAAKNILLEGLTNTELLSFFLS